MGVASENRGTLLVGFVPLTCMLIKMEIIPGFGGHYGVRLHIFRGRDAANGCGSHVLSQ
jgi:hypothetical protein